MPLEEAGIQEQITFEKELKGRLFDFIYGCALRDAILQLSFRGEKKWIYQVDEAKKALKKYIDKIIFENGFSSQAEHDAFFSAAANRICGAINGYSGKPLETCDTFSFGNAQKLINMTVKHFYTICYSNTMLRRNFQFCHCPMDGIMLQWVWKNYVDQEQKTRAERQRELGSSFCDSWGGENFQNAELPDRYRKFQEVIRKWAAKKGYSPIEFDFIVWESKD